MSSFFRFAYDNSFISLLVVQVLDNFAHATPPIEHLEIALSTDTNTFQHKKQPSFSIEWALLADTREDASASKASYPEDKALIIFQKKEVKQKQVDHW